MKRQGEVEKPGEQRILTMKKIKKKKEWGSNLRGGNKAGEFFLVDGTCTTGT